MKCSYSIVIGLLCVFAGSLKAQNHLSSVDSDYPGVSYLTGDAEVGGSFYVDANLTMQGSIYADSLEVNQEIYVGDLHMSVPLDGNQTDFTMDGGLELWSGFSPGMHANWGVANSWLHVGIDLGDLTYTDTDTPAFNLSQNSDGTFLYPTIYFTGYDANTTWVWQQNGLSAISNATLVKRQMELSGNGNLTLSNSVGNNTTQITPENGGITFTTATVQFHFNGGSSDGFTLITGNAAVIFTDAASNTTHSLTPASISASYASGIQSLGFGNNVTVSAWKSFAFGNDLSAAYYGSVVMGQANAIPGYLAVGNVTSWQTADPLFIVGNGDDVDPLTIYKNGDAVFQGPLTINGHVILNGNTTTFPGDVSLGATTTLTSAKGDIPLISN